MNALIALSLIFTVAACGHSVKKTAVPEAASEAAPAAVPVSALPEAFAPALRMPLPYTFTRRGVRIRVNSVEFAKESLQVSVTLEETRGQDVALLISTLMEPQTDTKKAMPYAGFVQEGKLNPDTEIQLKASERRSLDLAFRLPADAAGTPVVIQFTTGKWWSSKEE